jgi:drug/metabolite transporter (DMT)-like permease
MGRRLDRLLYVFLLGSLIVIGQSESAFALLKNLPSLPSPEASCFFQGRRISSWHVSPPTPRFRTPRHTNLGTKRRRLGQSHHVSLYAAPKPDVEQEKAPTLSSLLPQSSPESSSISSTSDKDDVIRVSDDERRLGAWVLLTVPFAWGTFEPAVRYVYAIEPPVPGFVFSVGYYLVAAVTLALLVVISSIIHKNDESTNELTPLGTAALNTSLPIRGGAELGVYLFLGNALQVLGLKTVPSDRAAFLLQLTTIFVPLVQSGFAGDLLAVPIRTWVACVIALAGVAVISLDGKELSDGTNMLDSLLGGFSSGDFLIVLAAFSYTFHCIRLERFAQETSAVKLAACKAATETILCGLLVTSLVLLGTNANAVDPVSPASVWAYAQEEGQDISHFVTSFSQQWESGYLPTAALLPALGAVFWTGWVTVAYTIYAQSFGQSRVKPADANLIYTIQPICTAIFAWLLLGETLGPLGYLGGAIIGFAVYLVIGNDLRDDESVKTE